MRILGFLAVMGVVAGATGCRPREEVLAAPAVEVVNVDVKEERAEVGPVVVGLGRPADKAELPAEVRSKLKRVLADGSAGLLVTLGESVKFDGKFPGEKGNWSKWDQGVTAAVKKHAGKKEVQWEVWNEPDRKGSFEGTREQFFAVWVHTAQLIRKLDAKAVLVGPGTMSNGWVSEFLKVSKEWDALPDVVCWHEEAHKADVAGHVNAAEESFWQDGTDRRHVRVMQTTASARKYVPGDLVILTAGLREARRPGASRGMREELAIKTHHLLTDDGQPRSILRALELMAGIGGTVVKVDRTDTMHGVAGRSEDGRKVELVLGRGRVRTTTDATPAEVRVKFHNLPAGTARVTVGRLPDSGAKAAEGVVEEMKFEMGVRNGELGFEVVGFGRGEVLVVNVEVTGEGVVAGNVHREEAE